MPWRLFLVFLSAFTVLAPAFATDGVWRTITHDGVGEIAVTSDIVYAIKGSQDIFCYKKKDGTSRILHNPYPDTYLVSITTSDDGKLFASTYHGDQDMSSDYGYLLQYNGTDWVKTAEYGDQMSRLAADCQNNIWAITRGQLQIGGFGIHIDSKTGMILNTIGRKDLFDHIIFADSLTWFLGDHILSVPDSLWYCLDSFTIFDRSTDYTLPFSGSTWGGVSDSSGVLWFGYNADTEWGLVKLDEGSWQKIGLTTQFKEVTTKAVDTRGGVWATTSKGLARFDGTTWTVYTPQNSGLPDTHITDIEVDRDGVVWIGTQGGLVSFTYDMSSAVKERTPAELKILANSPNPFNPSTTISFALPAPGGVSLTVYDINGRKVKELASGNFDAGAHAAMWDGCDAKGRMVSSGVYFARLVRSGHTATQKMLLMR